MVAHVKDPEPDMNDKPNPTTAKGKRQPVKARRDAKPAPSAGRKRPAAVAALPATGAGHSSPLAVKKTEKNSAEPRIGAGKPGPGRPPGAKNKVTLEIKEASAVHGPKALETIVKLLTGAKVPAAVRLAAANSILDRAYGRPTLYVEAETFHTEVIDTAAMNELYEKAMKKAEEDRIEMRKRREAIERGEFLEKR